MAEGLSDEGLKHAVDALNRLLAADDNAAFLIELRKVVEEYGGGVPDVARATKLHPKTLYKTLARTGNPELKTLVAVLKKMGLRLQIDLIPKSPRKPRVKQKRP